MGCAHLLIRFSAFLLFVLGAKTTTKERYYDFQVDYMSVTRLGVTKRLVAVNNLFPGPTIYANEDERLLIKVTNRVEREISIHWHGVRQKLSAWYDGPGYVTQCPLQKDESYVYNFTLSGQRGTMFWHAHSTWLRATVYGAIVIYPNNGTPYPFKYPFNEHVILLGEWWNKDVENVEATMLQTGGAPDLSDAYTINGLPGTLFNNSEQDIFTMRVTPGKTYLLRLVNAALNTELFFSITQHTLVVVEVDGEYTKPYWTDSIMLTPGQSANLLVTADQQVDEYLIYAGPYISVPGPFAFVNTSATASFRYNGSEKLPSKLPVAAQIPHTKDTPYVEKLTKNIRSLKQGVVPNNIDQSLFFALGMGFLDCKSCQGVKNGSRLASTFNNVSFVLPRSVALLQAHYYNIPGIYTTDFPGKPAVQFNYTGKVPSNMNVEKGTKVYVIPFNSNVEIIFQDTNFIAFENHPVHVHGYSFYVVGKGFGNFNRATAEFNLFDPPLRNTVGVPSGGWAAIRFKADNPGVWYVHCHLEVHTTWGLAMAFIVTNGVGANQTLPPPPKDLPKCRG